MEMESAVSISVFAAIPKSVKENLKTERLQGEGNLPCRPIHQGKSIALSPSSQGLNSIPITKDWGLPRPGIHLFGQQKDALPPSGLTPYLVYFPCF